MDIITLDGGNMKKIYPIIERVVCIFTILLLSVVSIFLFVNNRETFFVIIAYMCITFIAAALLKLFSFPSHLIISDNRIKVFDFPLFATNKFYVRKRSLILWNSEIEISEVKKIELTKLNKEEQKICMGYSRLCNKYLKIDLEYGKHKYIYVGNYSNSQIKNVIELASNR